MAALPYMQLYVADYLADTLYLDVVESGAYLHLLMNYWQTGKPLPDDDKKLARISKCSEEQWLNVRSTVVAYFVQHEGQLIHQRVERDLDRIREKTDKARDAGKKSAEARKKRSKTNGKINGRSTDVPTDVKADAANGVERPSIYTDTDTDTDTDTECVRDAHTPALSRQVPEDWQPDEILPTQVHIQPGVDVEFEMRQFRLHTFNRPKRRSEWQSEWLKWLNQAEPRNLPRSVKPKFGIDPAWLAQGEG